MSASPPTRHSGPLGDRFGRVHRSLRISVTDRCNIRHILRDYYRAETSTLRRFWLFRRHQDSAWFLHGEFD
jgi:hypothetical protein